VPLVGTRRVRATTRDCPYVDVLERIGSEDLSSPRDQMAKGVRPRMSRKGIHCVKFSVPKTLEAKIYLRPHADWKNDVKRGYPTRGYTTIKPPPSQNTQ